MAFVKRTGFARESDGTIIESVHLGTQTSSTLVAYTVVDLSDTTNWNHTNTGHVVLDYIILEVDPDASWLGEVKLGYLKNVDATNGDFVQLLAIDMTQKSDILLEVIEFGSHGLHCTDNHHFGPTVANSTLFQTDVNLGGPDDPSSGTYPSGAGDIALIVDGDGVNTVGVSITIGYETVA